MVLFQTEFKILAQQMSVNTLGHGFTTRSESALHFTQLRLDEVANTSQHEDFLSFLSLVQMLEVEILPLVWYPALHIGIGGFAVLNQAPVNRQTSFIFKRLKPSRTLDSDTSPRTFSSSMLEVAILTHQNVKIHPYIIDFYGICWEVSPVTDQILPVLVLEKAKYGDLSVFRGTLEGQKLSVERKLQLCYQIASGLAMLHASFIIHGDIKPENILICESAQGELVAKITDFGSSKAGQTEEDMYELHRSPTWSAPEQHHRAISIAAAKRIDAYSFSLLCVWLFLDSSHEAIDGASATTIIYHMKSSNTVQAGARETIFSLDLESTTRARVLYVVQTNLASEPLERMLKLQSVAELLDPDQQKHTIVYEGTPVCREVSHTAFKISHNLYALTHGNYLVRILMFLCYQHKANTSKCKKCTRKAAFELAFCHYIGFGTASDHQQAEFWVKKARKTMEDLEDEKDEVIDYVLYPNPIVNDLRKHAFSMIMDHANEYRRSDYDIRLVLDFLQREIRDLDEAFPDQYMLTTTLRGVIASVYLGPDKLRTQREYIANCQQRLAEIQRQNKKLPEAEKLAQGCLARRTKIEESISAETIECMSTLGSILFDAGKTEEAIKLFTNVSHNAATLLGPEHPQTLFGMSNLACAFRIRGMLNEALNLDLKVIRIKERTLDNENHAHFSTVTSASNLASTYCCQKRWDKAEEIERWVLQERSNSVGEQHPATLLARKQLAETYRQQGKSESEKKPIEMNIQDRGPRINNPASGIQRPKWE